MASFRYKALNESGAPVAGTLVADSAGEARARLREMRLFPERIVRAERAVPRLLVRYLPGARWKARERATLFTRQCAVLLATGVPIVEALDVLARQAEDRAFSLVLLEIREAVNAGASFADALAGYPHLFDRSYVGMVASGEKSGALDAVFSRLADFLERRRLMHAKLSTAFIYPAILVAMVFGLLLFLSGVVVPQISPLLEQHNRPLPLTTWLLFRLGDLVRGYGWTILPAAVAVIVALGWARRTRRGRHALDSLALRVPLIGQVVRKSLVSRFAMSFATLLRTGIPALEGLEVLGSLTPNAVFAAEIAQIRDAVIEGKDMSSRISGSKLFPPMVGYMVAVGERSGNLAEVLEHVSNAYDLEVEITSRRMLAVLEPVLILIMAGVVGFIAMSLMITILELSRF